LSESIKSKPAASDSCDQAAAALDRIRDALPDADPQKYLPDVSPERIPRHIAIIMDGNGRWAISKGKPRQLGHQQGVETVRKVVAEAGRLGIEFVTLYSFSTENWKRPEDEIRDLMSLCELYCQSQLAELTANNIKVRVIGRREGLPESVLAALDMLVTKTNENTNKGPTLCLAINYGSREEILDATKIIAEKVAAGELDPCGITADDITKNLYTAGMPDPDLLIRTAGEMRLSNYLLWQISYAELYITQTLWPEFAEDDLHEAVRAYAKRDRRFGGLSKGI